MSHRKLISTTALVLVTATVFAACRSPRRGVRVGSDAARLDVTMTGLAAEDSNNSSWVYELSGCMSPLNGVLGSDNKVAFTAIGLKAGLENCQFKVRASQLSPTMKPIEEAESGVLYFARDLTISQDAAGQLIASAPLQKLFENVVPSDARKKFTLNIPVKFSSAETEDPVTAALRCTPEIPNVGTYTRKNATTGEISFSLPIESAIEYSCSDLYVSVAGKLHKFRGSFIGTSGKFTAAADQTGTLASVDMILQDNGTTTPPTDQGSVSVDTKAAECNTEGKVFDVATGECKTK
jgi:hypothetical protein